MKSSLCLALALLASPAWAGDVSRLPNVPEDKLKELGAARAAQGSILTNLTLTTGHAPQIAQATGRVALAQRNDTSAPRELVEYAILRTAWNVGSEYEYVQHQTLSRNCKYPQAKLDAIPTWPNATVFNDKERALLAYVDEMTKGDVTNITWDAFARHFPPQEIVELSSVIGNYWGNGLLTKALRIKLETGGRVSSQGRC